MIKIFRDFIEEQNGILWLLIIVLIAILILFVQNILLTNRVYNMSVKIDEIYGCFNLPVNNSSDVEWHKELERMADIVEKYEKEHGKGNKK